MPTLGADAQIFNPGEPVFDQSTGEPLIDADGAFVEVAPGLLVTGPDGRSHDGDDVVNAAYLRASLFEGEVIRDRSIGVPYLRQGLGQSGLSLAVDLVVGEIRRRTPGVAGVVGIVIDGLSHVTRVLQWRGRFIKRRRAGEVSATMTTGG